MVRSETLVVAALMAALPCVGPSAQAAEAPAFRTAAGDPPAAGGPSPVRFAVLPSLGPLAGEIALGKSKAWTASVKDSRLVLEDRTDKDAIRRYTATWDKPRSAGRTAGIRVEAEGPGTGYEASAAGLVFRQDADQDTYLAWVLTGDGKVALDRRDGSGFKILRSFNIPGGHRPGGDLLEVRETASATSLLVNGRVVGPVRPDDEAAIGDVDKVGLIAVGAGRLTFREFTTGPAAPDTLADAGPVPAPDAASAQDPAPAAGPVPGLVGFETLADQLVLGPSGAWSVHTEGGRLVLSNADTPGAVRYYAAPWPGDPSSEGSVSVKIDASGRGPLSGGGLVFRVGDGDPRWLAWVVTRDGKVALYRRTPDDLKLVASNDIPGGHRPGGDVLQIDRTATATHLLVNGHPILDTPPDSGERNAAAPVGIIALGTGAFTFADLRYGPKPAAGSGTGAKPAAAAKADLPNLGPLGTGIGIGRDGAWVRAVEGGKLIFTNDADQDGSYTRTIGWPRGAEAGRSVSVHVDAAGGSDPHRGGGIAIGYADGGDRYLGVIVTPERKGALVRIKGGSLDFITSVDLPAERTGDDLVQVSQRGATTTFLVDGQVVTVISPDDGRGLDTSGDAGLLAIGIGRFAYSDFAFGPAIPAAVPAPPQPEPVPPPPSPFPQPSPDTLPPRFDAAQDLVGLWHSVAASSAGLKDATIDIQPQGRYKSEAQTPTQQGPVTVTIQGQWSTMPLGENRIQLILTPTQWSPREACSQPGVCTPIDLAPETSTLDVVDRNTLRSDVGISTRVR